MDCHWLRITQGRLLDLGQHEWPAHLAESSPERAAAKLVLGQSVQFPVSDAPGLAVVKNAIAWTGIKVRGLER